MRTTLIATLAIILANTGFCMDQATIIISKVMDAPTRDTREMTLKHNNQSETLLVDRNVQIYDKEISDAKLSGGDTPAIEITLTKEGTQKIAALTQAWKGKRLAILLEGQLISAPVVMEQISGPSLTITGNFTREFADKIVATIKKGKNG